MHLHCGEYGFGITDGVIDLTTPGVSCHTQSYQQGKLLALAAHQRGHQQPGDYAAVAVGKVAEVVVRAHRAAVDGVFLAHAFLDEGAAGFALNSLAGILCAYVDGVPSQARVMDDLGAWFLLEEAFGKQADDVVALDEFAAFIEEEAAVEIAIPGDTHVRPVCFYRIGGGGTVLRQDGIGNTVGEGAISLVMYRDELNLGAQGLDALLQGVDDVADSDHQLERPQINRADVAEQVFDIGVPAGLANQRAMSTDRCEVARLGQALDVL